MYSDSQRFLIAQEIHAPLSFGVTPPSSTPINTTCHISPRCKTVTKLQELLDEFRVVYIRGTPTSGKATLAKLLKARYKQQHKPLLYINVWHRVTDTIGHLTMLFQQHGYDVSRHTFVDSNIVIIFDEAQHSYTDINLWNGLIKTQSGVGSGPRICLFASYGSLTRGPMEYTVESPRCTSVRSKGYP